MFRFGNKSSEDDLAALEAQIDKYDNGRSGWTGTKLRWILPLLAGLVLLAGAAWFVREQGEMPVGVASATMGTTPATRRAQFAVVTSPFPTSNTVTPLPPNPSATVLPPTTTVTRSLYDVSALQEQMLTRINEARIAAGLKPVDWDPIAAKAGRLHTEDMVEHDYFSHWNIDGLGPEHRYALVGGRHFVSENLHAYSYTRADGSGAPIEDWEMVIDQAHSGLMDSPGHRANILDAAHTHVGIGMAYDEGSGQFRLAQEFTNQYVTLTSPLPQRAETGTTIEVSGRLRSTEATVGNMLLNLAYEPLPDPVSLSWLADTGTYHSMAESQETWAIDSDFSEHIVLGNMPGLYHIRIFADISGEQAMVVDHIIWVDEND